MSLLAEVSLGTCQLSGPRDLVGRPGRPGLAQQSIDYASVSGRVTDPSMAVVAGAQVTVRHTDTGVTGATETDREGRFRFPYLRVGPYEVTVRQQGFREAIQPADSDRGRRVRAACVAGARGVDTSVTVTGQADVLEAARSQIASTVSQVGGPDPSAQRPQLPRVWHYWFPAFHRRTSGSTQLFPETSAVPGVSISVGSQRNLSNNFIVDGLSANDDAAGLSGITYGVDAVEQFQVVTSGGQAELGRALGGYVNVVTKSGTNVVRGTCL